MGNDNEAEADPDVREESSRAFAPGVLPDLYLAFACGQGNPTELARFTERFAPVVERVRRRFGSRAPAADELLADVHERLFVRRVGGAPRISDFAGHSSLASWLNVVTARLLLNRIASANVPDAFEDKLLDTLATTTDGPERLLQRAQSHSQFRALFTNSIRRLTPRERQILRLAFVEQCTIDDLASLYGVHRTTAFRKIRQVTDRLSALLRSETRAELGMTDSEYERWCESVRSGLELSVNRYFGHTASGSDAP